MNNGSSIDFGELIKLGFILASVSAATITLIALGLGFS